MSTPSSPKYSAAMLLAPANHHNSHTIKTPKNYDSPRLMAMGVSGPSTNLPSASSSSSNYNNNSSSNLIIDNQGQAHDPGYLDALRQLHQQIGQNAIGERRMESKRRTASMAAGSSNAPSRPSALGLGLSSREMARLNAGANGGYGGNASDSNSSSDDDEDEEDWDSYTSLFEDAKKRDAQLQRANSMAAAYTPSIGYQSGSTFNSPRYNNSPLPPSSSSATNNYNSSGVSPTSTPLFASGGSGHFTPRRDSQSGSTANNTSGTSHRPSLAFALNADLEEEMNEAAATNSNGKTSRGRKSDRSTSSSTKSSSRRLSLPTNRSNSPPLPSGAHSIIAPRATYGATTISATTALDRDADWGFTGIVDVERERKYLNNQGGNSNYEPRSNSLFDDDDFSLPPAKSAPDSPSLVAAASLHRNMRTPPLNERTTSGNSVNTSGSYTQIGTKLRAASFSQHKSNNKNLTKKGSNSDVASISSTSIRNGIISPDNSSPNHQFLSHTPPGPQQQSRKGSLSAAMGSSIRAKSPSIRQKFSNAVSGAGPRKGTSRSRPSSSSSAQQAAPPSSFGGHTKSDLGAERPRDYTGLDNNNERLLGPSGVGLSTIQSGRLLDGNHPIINSNHSSLTSDSQNAAAVVHQSLPASRTSLSSLSTSARERLENEFQQMQLQNQHLKNSDLSNEFGAGDENSQYLGVGGIPKKGHGLGEYASQQSHDLRRKMDIFTMGLRFNAFKAKRKLERGFKHHEA